MKRAAVIPYEEYKEIQIHRSGKKWGSSTFWKSIDIFQSMLQIVVQRTGDYPKSICCMGIRSGNEYHGFKETIGFTKCEIYGVDIHPNVVKVGDNCFCYDFAQLPKEWEKKFDWVYSNSIDHAYDLEKTLKEWHRICKGYILLTMSNETNVEQSDVYSFSMNDVDTLFDKELFELVKVWQMPGADTTFNVLLKIL